MRGASRGLFRACVMRSLSRRARTVRKILQRAAQFRRIASCARVLGHSIALGEKSLFRVDEVAIRGGILLKIVGFI